MDNEIAERHFAKTYYDVCLQKHYSKIYLEKTNRRDSILYGLSAFIPFVVLIIIPFCLNQINWITILCSVTAGVALVYSFLQCLPFMQKSKNLAGAYADYCQADSFMFFIWQKYKLGMLTAQDIITAEEKTQDMLNKAETLLARENYAPKEKKKAFNKSELKAREEALKDLHQIYYVDESQITSLFTEFISFQEERRREK